MTDTPDPADVLARHQEMPAFSGSYCLECSAEPSHFVAWPCDAVKMAELAQQVEAAYHAYRRDVTADYATALQAERVETARLRVENENMRAQLESEQSWRD